MTKPMRSWTSGVGPPVPPRPLLLPSRHLLTIRLLFRLHILEGAGHSPMLEKPDGFHPLLLAFLARPTPAL